MGLKSLIFVYGERKKAPREKKKILDRTRFLSKVRRRSSVQAVREKGAESSVD